MFRRLKALAADKAVPVRAGLRAPERAEQLIGFERSAPAQPQLGAVAGGEKDAPLCAKLPQARAAASDAAEAVIANRSRTPTGARELSIPAIRISKPTPPSSAAPHTKRHPAARRFRMAWDCAANNHL